MQVKENPYSGIFFALKAYRTFPKILFHENKSLSSLSSSSDPVISWAYDCGYINTFNKRLYI